MGDAITRETVKLVQMPAELVRLDDAQLAELNVDPGLLATFRTYLPRASDDPRGVAILAPPFELHPRAVDGSARRSRRGVERRKHCSAQSGGDLRTGRKSSATCPARRSPPRCEIRPRGERWPVRRPASSRISTKPGRRKKPPRHHMPRSLSCLASVMQLAYQPYQRGSRAFPGGLEHELRARHRASNRCRVPATPT